MQCSNYYYFDLQIGFLAIFFIFNIIFWAVALNNYFNEIKFYDEFGVKIEEPMMHQKLLSNQFIFYVYFMYFRYFKLKYIELLYLNTCTSHSTVQVLNLSTVLCLFDDFCSYAQWSIFSSSLMSLVDSFSSSSWILLGFFILSLHLSSIFLKVFCLSSDRVLPP